MSLDLTVTDLFCGAGGSSIGAELAGATLKMAANHWSLAVETHNANFPDAGHDCADVSQVDPRRYPSTDVLIASPECTHHSQARTNRHVANLFDPNGDPAAERSRATMWDVVRFAERHAYQLVIVENVVEIVRWPPFDAWLSAMHALGYRHELVCLNSMVAPPTPQSRDRMYVVFWRAGNRAPDLRFTPSCWCPACDTNVEGVQSWKVPGRTAGKYRTQYLYRCPKCSGVAWPYAWPAASAIDWSLPTPRVGDRARPLAPATLRRIAIGLERFGVALVQKSGHTPTSVPATPGPGRSPGPCPPRRPRRTTPSPARRSCSPSTTTAAAMALEDTFPSATFGHWQEYKDGNAQALELYERHYSARQYADGRVRELFMGPGQKTVLLTAAGDALFGWRRFKDDSGQEGVNCSVFRNEGRVLSSDLIREAMAIAWLRWPGERLYTYVDGGKITSNPGYCFIKAGWTKAGTTRGGLQVLEALPGANVPAVEATPALLSVFGNQDLELREERIIGFSDGEFRLLATKPTLSGSGCNFQRHCHRQVFVGVGFKFNDFIQALHRCHRYLQRHPVRIDVVYAESEREVVKTLRRKWAQHKELTEQMSDLIREHGLNQTSIAKALERSLGVERVEVTGEGWTLANNDCVEETRAMAEASVDEIVTSIPFAYQYEYTPSYNDFGHTESNEHFWAQMDFLTPELHRVLRPGRIYACHVKDRILFGNVTGAGYSTVSPFHAEAIMHGLRHGFEYMGMITVVTDVVRENNQSYRLGWSENAKDGSKMGVGSPEYVLLFRKPQSDRTRGYADVPVVKSKDDYSRARWQVDAHAFWRSDGNRPLTAEDMRGLSTAQRMRLFEAWTLAGLYDFEVHVAIGEAMDGPAGMGVLPSTFMLLAPASPHPDVWSDVNRMRTLNTEQSRRNLAMHVCPLQYDIVDRLIERYSNPGEVVFDPFAGLGTVPLRALRAGRRGRGVELNPEYFGDSVRYLRAEEARVGAPSLFDLIDLEAADVEAERVEATA